MKTKDLVYIALSVVVIAACSWLSIPSAVPFTLQTFGVFFVLFFLGAKKGGIAIAIYILLGVVGAPVFHNFTGGIGIIMGATGGYIIGFIASAIIYGLTTSILKNSRWSRLLGAFLGLLAVYAVGSVWYAFVYAQGADASSFLTALTVCVLPYIAPDLIKIALAFFIDIKLKKILRTEARR